MEEQTRVHHKTLTALSKGELDSPKPKKMKTRKSLPITHIKVDPRVMKVALRLAKGDKKRLKIRNSTTVSVLNPREWL